MTPESPNRTPETNNPKTPTHLLSPEDQVSQEINRERLAASERATLARERSPLAGPQENQLASQRDKLAESEWATLARENRERLATSERTTLARERADSWNISGTPDESPQSEIERKNLQSYKDIADQLQKELNFTSRSGENLKLTQLQDTEGNQVFEINKNSTTSGESRFLLRQTKEGTYDLKVIPPKLANRESADQVNISDLEPQELRKVLDKFENRIQENQEIEKEKAEKIERQRAEQLQEATDKYAANDLLESEMNGMI